MNILKKIESIIINRIDQYFGYYRYLIGYRNIGTLNNTENNNIYYLMTPSFCNIGDEAIVEATILYLSDYFPEYTINLIDFMDTYQMLKEIRRVIKKEDIIILQGGGNIGTLYYEAECMREFIIRRFPDIRIISMPQSMFFANDSFGNRKYKKCKKVYNTHANLTIIARDKYTFSNMKKSFTNTNIILSPDIVFYLSKLTQINKSVMRSGILVCLRTDKEDVLGDKRIDLIRTLALEFTDIIISDTCVSRTIPEKIRNIEVMSLINQFNKSELVITDRLHGMVFAAITNTPCIVIPSVDTKIIGTYEWLDGIDFIKFLQNPNTDEIISLAKKMKHYEVVPYDWSKFRTNHFDELRSEITV